MKKLSILLFVLLISPALAQTHSSLISTWEKEWPNTDFSKTNIKLESIFSGGPPKDGIPSIDNPIFKPVSQITNIGDKEPLISININGDARAYPLRILIYHEIVNDIVGNTPVTVTYCPLCNASLTFERRLDGKLLDFGTTGKLRNSDLVMYDRQTESWWQQFTGQGIVGQFTDKKLKLIPSRIESFSLFKKRHPRGKVLVPNNPGARNYGNNPYVMYDSNRWPFLYRGEFKEDLKPLERVVAVGNKAWSLALLKKNKKIIDQNLILIWQAGQNSALNSKKINQGKDIGNVFVTRNGKDVVHHIPFAFAFKAFMPEGTIITKLPSNK